MIKEQGFDDGLGEVNQPVVSFDMRQLVGQDQFDLGRVEARNRGNGQQDDGPKTTDNRRDLNQCRLGKPNGPIHPETLLHALACMPQGIG